MALLNVLKHMEFRPLIPYRFNCEIWPHGDKDHAATSKLTFTILKVAQPVIKLGSENKMNYGNTSYVIPILKFGETTLNITFEETDDLSVLNFLSSCHSMNPYDNADSLLIDIHIQQFDLHMNTTVDDKYYVVKLKSYNMPNYNNTGYGRPVTIDAEFFVLYTYDNMDNLNEINTVNMVIQRNLNDYETENIALDTANANITEWERTHRTDNTNRAALIRAISLKMRNKTKNAAQKNNNLSSYVKENVQQHLRAFVVDQQKFYTEKLINELKNTKKRNPVIISDINAQESLNKIIENLENNKTLSETEQDFIIQNVLDIDHSDRLDTQEILNIKTILEYMSNQEDYENQNDVKSVLNEFTKKSNATPPAERINAVNAHELDYGNMSTEELNKLAKQLGVTEKDIDNTAKELYDLWTANNITGTGSNKIASYQASEYSTYRNMSDSAFRKLSSNGWCSAYTSTEISKYLGLDTRLQGAKASDYVSTNMVSQINSTGRATAEIIDMDITSVADINNLRSLPTDENTMYVVSTKFVNLSDKNKEKFKQRTIDNGHVVAITSEGVSQGQKNVNPYKDLTDEMIKSGEIQIKVMKIKRKPGIYNSNMGNINNIDNELEVI